MIPNHMFIANDTYLDDKKNRWPSLQGRIWPGKSTYMRQTALIVLMAQIGSFVPASQANIGLVDRILYEGRASDDLASGQSTFMVEMTEVANILRNATSKSLLILDEIGRGTSTFDGLSIAWAVVEHISNARLLGQRRSLRLIIMSLPSWKERSTASTITVLQSRKKAMTSYFFVKL